MPAEDLDLVERILKELISAEMKSYKEARKHGDHKNLRAHGGLLSILISSLVKVVLAKQKIGTLESPKSLDEILSEIEI